MAKKGADEEGRQVPIVWVGLESEPVHAVNNMIAQFHEDLFIVQFGFANLPVVMGTPAQAKKQIASIDAVTVSPVARLAMSESQVEKTIKALQSNLKRYRKMKKDVK